MLKFLVQTFHTYFLKQSIFEASEALQKWEGMILKKTRSFRWFFGNSEVEATWASLIGWPHKTSIIYVLPLTCVPNILDPDVGAGSKEQPMNRDEQKANHVGRDGNANEKYWECLKNKQKEQIISMIWDSNTHLTKLGLAIRPLWDLLANSCLILEVWQ